MEEIVGSARFKGTQASRIFVSINANRITGAEPKAAVRIIGMNTFVNRARSITAELCLSNYY